MEVMQNGNDTVIVGIEYFDPDLTFDCGQCFRFSKNEDGGWSGIAHGRRLTLRLDGDRLTLKGCSLSDFDALWRDYLGLSEDYGMIRAELAAIGDAHLLEAMETGKGIRILRQEPWEALCSFVVSQNNNIGRIRKIIAALCQKYGDRLGAGESIAQDHAFPTPSQLASATLDELTALGLGYRAEYIHNISTAVADGTLDLAAIAAMPTDAAVKELCGIKGIGVKVASCALLFGFRKDDAFPIDVWVKRILAKYYAEYGGKSPDFGRYAGLCQQYLFYFERYLQG